MLRVLSSSAQTRVAVRCPSAARRAPSLSIGSLSTVHPTWLRLAPVLTPPSSAFAHAW